MFNNTQEMRLQGQEKLALPDRGGRRLTGERRKMRYTLHVPERRNGHDRRSGRDRRRLPRSPDA